MLRLAILGFVVLLAGLPVTILAARADEQPPAAAPPLILLLASDQPTYQPGATATFSLAVDNPGPAPVAVTFPSRQLYDLVVLHGEVEVWRWSAERGFAMVLTERTFPPGVTLLGRERWDWRGSDGTPLPPGTYRAVASLAVDPRQDGNAVEISLSAP